MNFGLTSDLSFVGLPCCFLCVGKLGEGNDSERETARAIACKLKSSVAIHP